MRWTHLLRVCSWMRIKSEICQLSSSDSKLYKSINFRKVCSRRKIYTFLTQSTLRIAITGISYHVEWSKVFTLKIIGALFFAQFRCQLILSGICYFETFVIGTISSKIPSKFQFHPRIQVFQTVCALHLVKLCHN